MATVIVFDVNETLLDLAALDPLFAETFGDASVRREWFSQVLLSSMTATLANRYAGFDEIGAAALTMIGERHGVAVDTSFRQAVGDGMRHLPPHPDVPEAIARLREAGFRLATLTNNPPPVVEAQLSNAGIRDQIDLVLSVEAVRRFKPAPEVYSMAAQRLDIPIGDMRLVAAHGWDVAGAMAAGSAAAFVARPGCVLDPIHPEPDIVGPDLSAVASEIIARDSP